MKKTLPLFNIYRDSTATRPFPAIAASLCIFGLALVGCSLFYGHHRVQVAHKETSAPTIEVNVAQCTRNEMATIDTVFSTEIRRRESKCPDASWLDDYYSHKHLKRLHERAEPFDGEEATRNKDDAFLSICVGCNKGYDSLNLMRMGSANAKFDSEVWRGGLDEFSPTHGACGQEGAGQFQIPFLDGDGPPDGHFTSAYVVENAETHCIEPLRANIDMVNKTMKSLGWNKEGFTMTHAAIAEFDGSIPFPKAMPGVENLGMFSCDDPGADCEEVKMYSLDTYVTKFVESGRPINMLSIDVEGHDFEVLRGATQKTLPRTEYLEFEFHQVGPWAKHSLLDAVDLLDDHGFTCYWAGKRRLFRITQCWSGQYDEHFWSNVACVKRTNVDLATRMEAMFQAGLLMQKK